MPAFSCCADESGETAPAEITASVSSFVVVKFGLAGHTAIIIILIDIIVLF